MQRNRGDVFFRVHQLAELLPVAPDSLQSLLLELRELAGLAHGILDAHPLGSGEELVGRLRQELHLFGPLLSTPSQGASAPNLVLRRGRPRSAAELGRLAEGFLDEGEALTSSSHGGLVEPRVPVVAALVFILHHLLLIGLVFFNNLLLSLFLNLGARQCQHHAVFLLVLLVGAIIAEDVGPSFGRQQGRGLSFCRHGERLVLSTGEGSVAPELRIRVPAPPRVFRTNLREGLGRGYLPPTIALVARHPAVAVLERGLHVEPIGELLKSDVG